MRKRLFLGLCIALLTTLFGQTDLAAANEPKRVNCETLGDNSPATRSAQAWLELVDNGDYRQTWIAASEFVRCRHQECKWSRHLCKIRRCYGKVLSRELMCHEYECNVQGFPAGQYYWMQYNTCFTCGPACEVVILRCERDCAAGSRWRVVHYSVQ